MALKTTTIDLEHNAGQDIHSKCGVDQERLLIKYLKKPGHCFVCSERARERFQKVNQPHNHHLD